MIMPYPCPASPCHRFPRSRSRSAVLLAVTTLLVSFFLGGPAAAATPERPSFYAIENARVVVGDGTELERATVLVADGLIEDVGPDLEIPADAWVIDGEGLVVIPGLIDPLTSLGLAQEDDEPGDRGGSRGGPGGGSNEPAPVLGPESRPDTHPWREAGDAVDPEADFEDWRQAGFTSALTSHGDGYFTGRASLIHLGGGDAKDRVLARSVAQRMGLDPRPGFRRFPGSLMGVLAYVDQTFMDTRHFQTATALYEASPRGRRAPRLEATLDALARDLDDRRPFLVPAVSDLEIDRALAMAETHGLRIILYGGHGAYDRLQRLSDAATPILLSLDWPEAEKDRDPDAEESFRDLYHRRMSRATPQMLRQAGVPFAFYSGGLSSPSQVFANVREATDAGLDTGAALEAMTSGAARILGLDDRLGTVSPGKMAHLVLASDLPWAEDAEIHGVMIGGHYHAERGDEDEDAEPPAADASGTWALKLETPRGVRDFEAKIDMAEDGKVSGELISERGSSDVEKGRMSGDRLRFESTRSMGSRSMTVSYSLLVEGEALSGTASAGPMVMDITGERTEKAGDKQESEETAADEVTLDELREAMAAYRGPAREMGDFAITGATVYTVSGEVIENGTVVVAGGKITAVGAGLEAPAGLEVIDANGLSLIPGIIDAHSHIAIDGAGNEGSLAVTSMVTIQDVIDPHDIGIYRALAGGVTSINILHGSANPIGGGNAVVKLRWGQNAEGLRFEGAPEGIKFALGENPKRSRIAGSPGPKRYPATRMGVMDVIRQAFVEAEAYRDEWRRYETAKARGETPMPPRKDRKYEALVEILEGERLVHSHCYRADEILQLLRLAEEFGFKIASLQHVLEGFKVADEIAAHGAGASTFSDWWGYKVEAYESIPHNAALMAERGVNVSINSDSAEEMRHLNQEAAKAVRWGGADENEALRMVTLNPAMQLGIDARVGSIEVGKDADLVLYDGHPLSARSVVQKTFVDGHLFFDRELDRQRQATIDAVKARLDPPDDDSEQDESAPEDSAAEPAVKIYDMDYTCRDHFHGHLAGGEAR